MTPRHKDNFTELRIEEGVVSRLEGHLRKIAKEWAWCYKDDDKQLQPTIAASHHKESVSQDQSYLFFV